MLHPYNPETDLTRGKHIFTCLFHTEEALVMKKAVQKACQALVETEQHLNNLDAGAGDGDCGTTMADGAQGLLE